MESGYFCEARSFYVDDRDLRPIAGDCGTQRVDGIGNVHGMVVKAEGSGERLRETRVVLEYNNRQGLHTLPQIQTVVHGGGGCEDRLYARRKPQTVTDE